jgi:hypothetical protein
MVFLFIFPWQTTGLRISPYQKFVELLPRIAFHIYLLIIINIITKPAHFRSPSCLRDFWQIKSDNSNAKHVFGLFTFYRKFGTEIFFYEIKYLVNPQLNILYILTRNVILFYDYSNWGELSFNIFKFLM